MPPDNTTPLPSRRRAPSSVSLVVGALLLALVAVMAIPVIGVFIGAIDSPPSDGIGGE